jgi:hypothetical protein
VNGSLSAAGVDPALLAAYRATDFHLDTDPPLILRAGQRNPDLDTLLTAQGVSGGAYLTAWNPHSRICPVAENAHAQECLIATLTATDLRWLTGRGQAWANDWPAEESLLVLGISRSGAVALARQFNQNAILWVQIGMAAVLIDCTLPP